MVRSAGYCSVPHFGEGLIVDTLPNVNYSNTAYYEHEATIQFTCEDVYRDLNCSLQNCQITCNYAMWLPSVVPTCFNGKFALKNIYP